MARNGRPDEWSCPLCTLLNAWRDRRCAACDNERPAELEAAAGAGVSAPSARAAQEETAAPRQLPPPLQQRQQQQSLVYREASGVFFSSATLVSPSAAAWKQEPRLRVNRRRRAASSAAVKSSEAKGTGSETAPWPAEQRQPVPSTGDRGRECSNATASTDFALSTSDDADEDVDVPCFNLLGPGMGLLGDAAMTSDPFVAEGQGSRDESAGTYVDDVASHDDRYRAQVQHTEAAGGTDARNADYSNGFIPASRVVVQEDRAVEEKLASAGLDLSDSDDDAGEPHRLRRSKRPLSPVQESGSTTMGASGPSWECPVCTNFNGAHLSNCELCDTPKAQDAECSICAKILSPSATRCARCGTPRDPANNLIDLASSQEDKRPAAPDQRDINYDSDFENPYAPAPFNDAEYLGDTGGGYDSVEEISDNETIPQFSRPTSVRPDLKDFEHFVSVDDLRGDYGCKVDYRSMFTGGRTGKSYADRLASRRRESQKRKREAAKKADQTGASAGAAKPTRQTKPKRATKKGKAPANRRASTGTKRQRKGGTDERRSSAPTTASSVNYYDSSSVDFGDDVRTMAWEGVGSASYY